MARKTKIPNAKQYNVMLSENDRKRLDALADYTQMTGADIIRSAISTWYHMALEGTPACATGDRCFVPQMHARPITHEHRP